MKKKTWVIGFVVLAFVIAAVFPVRAAVREYRYQKYLAEIYAGQCKNVEYLKLRLDWMVECIDQALDSEEPVEQRSALRHCYTSAGDFYDGFLEAHGFRAHRAAYYQIMRTADGELLSGLYDGFNGFFEYCIPYLDGALELDGEEFSGVMTACRDDILWMKDQLDAAFPENWEPSDEEFINAWKGMLSDDSSWNQVFSAARTAVQERSQNQ